MLKRRAREAAGCRRLGGCEGLSEPLLAWELPVQNRSVASPREAFFNQKWLGWA
jgi:hypothetical protein